VYHFRQGCTDRNDHRNDDLVVGSDYSSQVILYRRAVQNPPVTVLNSSSSLPEVIHGVQCFNNLFRKVTTKRVITPSTASKVDLYSAAIASHFRSVSSPVNSSCQYRLMRFLYNGNSNRIETRSNFCRTVGDTRHSELFLCVSLLGPKDDCEISRWRHGRKVVHNPMLPSSMVQSLVSLHDAWITHMGFERMFNDSCVYPLMLADLFLPVLQKKPPRNYSYLPHTGYSDELLLSLEAIVPKAVTNRRRIPPRSDGTFLEYSAIRDLSTTPCVSRATSLEMVFPINTRIAKWKLVILVTDYHHANRRISEPRTTRHPEIIE